MFSLRFFILAALVFSTFLLSACSDPDAKKQAHYDKGVEYIQQEQFKEAILEFRNAIQLDPSYAAAYYQLGLACLQANDSQRAFDAFQRAADLDPFNYDAQLKTAENFFLAGRLDESRSYLDKILARQADHWEALALLGEMELESGNIEAAEKAVVQAFEGHHAVSELYVLQARIFFAKKMNQEAEASLLKAIEIRPDEMSAYQILSSYYFEQHEEEKAVRLLLDAITAIPESPDPLLVLASFFLIKGEAEKSEQYISQALSIDQNNEQTFMHAADLYVRASKFDRAEEVLNSILAKSDDPQIVKGMLANVYVEQKKYPAAENLVNEIFSQNKKQPLANLVKARLYMKDGNNGEAVAILNQLVRDYPAWGDAYLQLGLAELVMGNFELSQNAAMAAVKNSGRNSRARTLLAYHHLRKREYNLARQEAVNALRLDARNIQAAVILGQSYLYAQDADKALEIFFQMNVLVPDNIEVLYNLALTRDARREVSDAKLLLERILGLQPEYTPALAKLSDIYLRYNEPDKALALLRSQVEKTPGVAGSRLLLGDMLYRRGMLAEARDVFEQVQAQAPENPQSYLMLATIEKESGRLDKAIAEYRNLLGRQPGSPPTLMGLAVLLEQAGKLAEAKDIYRQLLELEPQFAPAANNLAWLITREANPDLGEALRLAQIAKDSQPRNPYIIDTLGYVFYLRGAYDLATTQFRDSLSLLPHIATVRFHLALSLKAQGADNEALTELKKCIEQTTDFPEQKEAEMLLRSWQEVT